jgi:hypothetical protein
MEGQPLRWAERRAKSLHLLDGLAPLGRGLPSAGSRSAQLAVEWKTEGSSIE